MFRSIQTKILFVIAAIFAVTTCSTIYFTRHNVKKTVLETEIKNIENIHNIIVLNVEGKYKTLLLSKGVSVIKNKEKIKNEIEIINKSLSFYSKLNISDKDLKKKIIDFIKTIDITSQIFVADEKNDIIYNTIHKKTDLNLNNIYDVKTRSLTNSINDKNSSFKKFAVFSWDKKKDGFNKIGYLSKFEKLNWTIGITTDISEIEKESQKRIDQIIKVLKTNFSQIKIAATGNLFLFNNLDEIIIKPSKDLAFDKNHLKIFKDSALENRYITTTINKKGYICYTSWIKALNWYLTALVPVQELKQPADLLSKRLSVLILSIFITSMTILIFAVKKFSNPLKKLTLKLKSMPEKDLTSPEFSIYLEQNFSTKRKDEVGSLTKAFLFMFSQLQKNIQMLVKTTADKERIEGELNVARDIQLGILPKIFPPFPETPEFDIYAYLKPAKEVGGDLYDFFLIDDENLCFVIGDVSDKGVPAALFMAITKTLIKTNAENEKSPSKIMARVNEVLSKDNPNCMFVTLLIGFLNIKTGKVKYSNAGHNPPIIKTTEQTFYKKGISGPVAGAVEDMIYKDLELKLKNEEMIFLYTDGITEAMDTDKNLYSDEKLLKLIDENSFSTPEKYITKVKNSVQIFTKDAPQSDDITMLCFIFRGNNN